MATLLHVDASARTEGSLTRALTQRVVDRLSPDTIIRRDLVDALPQVDAAWIGANFTPADDRSAAQRAQLALSDTLVAELQAADTVVIGAPIYNFSVPSALKAWIDLIARAGVTFRYTENGPKGLLEGKRAVVVVASGGTPVGSDIDFVTPYLKHILGFVGITDVDVIVAERTAIDPDAARHGAETAIDRLAA